MALFLTKDLDDDAHSRLGVWHITESEAELQELCSIPSDELEATFIHKDGYEEQFDLEYMTFDRHVLVWIA